MNVNYWYNSGQLFNSRTEARAVKGSPIKVQVAPEKLADYSKRVCWLGVGDDSTLRSIDMSRDNTRMHYHVRSLVKA